MTVEGIGEQDVMCAGGDSLRVYCQRRDGAPATFATIEHGSGGGIRTRTWAFPTLRNDGPMDAEIAARFAAAYAERKNIPVVHVQVV